MIVQISRFGGRNKVVNAACAEWLNAGNTLSIEGDKLNVHVPDWNAFMHGLWYGFAETSKGSYPEFMRMKYLCYIMPHCTWAFVVWDEPCNGLRYGRM